VLAGGRTFVGSLGNSGVYCTCPQSTQSRCLTILSKVSRLCDLEPFYSSSGSAFGLSFFFPFFDCVVFAEVSSSLLEWP
jgi:hypothetical protein